MFDRRERRIRRTLAHLSKQRVAMRLNHPLPGHNKVWVIEMTPSATEETTDDLLSCLLRGWVEVLEDAMPSSELMSDGSLPLGPLMQAAKPVYRLTDSGWGVVRGTHTLAVWGMIVALISLAAALAAIAVDMRPARPANDAMEREATTPHSKSAVSGQVAGGTVGLHHPAA